MSRRNKKNKKRINNTRKTQYSLIAAIQEGNLQIVKDIIDKCLNFSLITQEGYNALCAAVKYNRIQITALLLSKNCRINRIDETDILDTPLHLAICNNDNDLVKTLLDKGACVNIKNYKGETPLHSSCQKKNLEISQLLLKTEPALADISDAKSNTPFHIAVEKECLETIKLLLNYEINVNACTMETNYKGFTPLHMAIMKKNEEIVKFLLENHANIHATIEIPCINGFNDNHSSCMNYENYTPLHLAVALNDYNMTKLLIDSGADVNLSIKHNDIMPLHIAVENRNKNIVILFSLCNANFKAKTKDGKNILHLAVENNWPELVEVLICKGADVDEKNNDGETPLYIAVEMGDEETVELLLKYNADVNITNSKCESPLHIAAEYSAEIVNILLSKGSYVDEINCNNETPLYIAVKHRNIEIIEELLQYKPNLHNRNNESAFSFAIKNTGYMDIINLLLEYGFTITPEDVNDTSLFYNSVSQGYVRIVKILLEHGLDISTNSENSEYEFLLHRALLSQNFEIAKLLIQYNCSLNSVDDNGHVPIDYAVQHNNLDILNLLLSNGAEVKNIIYPVIIAAKAKKEDERKSLLQILLQYGANVNASDEYGITALHFATWYKDYKLVLFLLDKKAYVNTTEIYKSIISINNSKDDHTMFKKKMFTSPLHIAVSKNSMDIVIILLEHYADINLKDGCGRTALHIASSMRSPKQKYIIETLISYGADINAVDDFNKLPLYYVYNPTCVCYKAFIDQYDLLKDCDCHSFDDYNYEDVIAVFIKHMCLLNEMNKSVADENLKLLQKSDFSENLQVSCLLEILRMKEVTIYNAVSFYNILIKKSNALAAYARNEYIEQVFQSDTYKMQFPLYGDLLEKQFHTALLRKGLLESLSLAFNYLLPKKLQLPDLVTEGISKFLNFTDLQNIILAPNRKRSANADINFANATKKLKTS